MGESRMPLYVKLAILSFFQFGTWGSYLTSMGTFIGSDKGLNRGDIVAIFYATQSIVSIFAPAIMGMIADTKIQAQMTYAICQLLNGLFMIGAYYFGKQLAIVPLYICFFGASTFFMSSLSLYNAVSYNALEKVGADSIKVFPPIRTFGTVGFIIMMISVDWLGFQTTSAQFLVSGIVSIILVIYNLIFIPKCEIKKDKANESLWTRLGFDAFKLFGIKKMAIFFIFSMFLGVNLQITNSYANPYITGFGDIPEYADTFGARHANTLISLSQISETLCILLIPFALKRFGIKNVMLISMVAWLLRFLLFGLGNPGSGVWLFVLSCIVYGVAFDFFNISGSLFVDKESDNKIRSSAQGLFMVMTNGIGSGIGILVAQFGVLNRLVYNPAVTDVIGGWKKFWFIFAAYSGVMAFAFIFLFRYNRKDEAEADEKIKTEKTEEGLVEHTEKA